MRGNEFELILLGVAAATGLLAGKMARVARLPGIIGYMLLGILLGVSGLKLLDEHIVEELSFVTEIALGFVAFTIGSELSVSSMGRQGFGVACIIFAESFGAFLIVLGGVYALTRDVPLALIFAAVAPASAPAGTVAVIREYKARGKLTKVLYAVVGFDDGLAIFIFGFADAVARSMLVHEATGASQSVLSMLAVPAEEIGLSIAVGVVIGFVFSRFVSALRNPGEIFVLVFAAVVAATGISLKLHLSLILTNMVIGLVLANTRREDTVRRIMVPVGHFMSLVFVLFFCLAGAHLDIGMLPRLGLLGLVYMVCRSAGLIGGSRLGGILGGAEEKVRKYVGLGILSQAGVAIGLSLIAKHQFDKIGTEHAVATGAIVIATVTATCVVFEIIGPILAKVALERAGEIPTGSSGSRADSDGAGDS
jgi:Kef-type K+ transport system membrane component KefB